jgi:hypothetical protein
MDGEISEKLGAGRGTTRKGQTQAELSVRPPLPLANFGKHGAEDYTRSKLIQDCLQLN